MKESEKFSRTTKNVLYSMDFLRFLFLIFQKKGHWKNIHEPWQSSKDFLSHPNCVWWNAYTNVDFYLERYLLTQKLTHNNEWISIHNSDNGSLFIIFYLPLFCRTIHSFDLGDTCPFLKERNGSISVFYTFFLKKFTF